MDKLKEKTEKGMFWSAINNGASQILNLVIGIFLARLLSPGDYGLVGVLTIFTMMANNIQQCGFFQGLINLKSPQPNDYNSVFWFNVLTGLLLYAILWFCAPLIAAYFRQDALVELSRFIFLVFLITAFGVAPNAYLTKNMKFKESAICAIAALVSSGLVGIYLAVRGYAYWSLAWQQVTFITVQNIIRYHYAKWRPNLHIDFTPVKRMFGFSVKILVTKSINTISDNILTFIFGRMFSIGDVGNFSQANKWNTLASSFVSQTVQQVSQTVLVSANDSQEHERRVFRKMLRFTSFLAFPCMIGLALVAKEFIFITIGEKWAMSVPLLQILCVSGAFIALHGIYQSLIISSGRSDIFMWVNITQIVLQIAVILAFANFGMTTMVIAYVCFTSAWVLVWHFISHKLINITLRQMLADTLPYLVTIVLASAVAHFATLPISSNFPLLVSKIVITAAIYIGIMYATKDDIMFETIDFVKKKFSHKS